MIRVLVVFLFSAVLSSTVYAASTRPNDFDREMKGAPLVPPPPEVPKPTARELWSGLSPQQKVAMYTAWEIANFGCKLVHYAKISYGHSGGIGGILRSVDLIATYDIPEHISKRFALDITNALKMLPEMDIAERYEWMVILGLVEEGITKKTCPQK